MKKITLHLTQDEELSDFWPLSEFERITLRYAIFCAVADEKEVFMERYSDDEITVLNKAYGFLEGGGI